MGIAADAREGLLPSLWTSGDLLILQAGNAGQLQAFQEFQGSAAAGGDVGDLVCEAQLLAGSRGVAAADDGHCVGIGQSLGHRDGALCQGGVLKDAHGAVPDDGLGVLHGVGEQSPGLLADVQALLVGGDGLNGHGLHINGAVDGVGEAGSHHGVHGQQQLDALALSLGHHVLAVADLLGIQQGVADAVALGGQEGVGHAAADNQGVHLLQKVVDHVQLVGNLGAAQDRHEGTLGVGQSLAHDGHFLLDQVAADVGQVVSHTGGGSVGPVSRAEGVVDENVGHGSQSLAQLGIVLGLTLFKAGVLQQHDVAVFQSGGLGPGILAGHVGSHNDLLAQQLADPVSHHLQAQLGLVLALGLAHVGAKDHLGTVVNQITDGGHGGHDPLVGRDDAVLGGDVEVAAAQHPLAGYVNVFNGLLVVVHSQSSIAIYVGSLLPHSAKILKRRKGKLPQRFVHGDGHRVAQVQAPGLRTHGNAQALLIVRCQKGLRKALGLLAEKEIAAVLKFRLGIAPGGFRGQTPHLPDLVFPEEILQILILKDLHHMPVIQSCPADGLF